LPDSENLQANALPGGWRCNDLELATVMAIVSVLESWVDPGEHQKHPAVRALWRECIGEGATSTVDLELTDAEIAAVYGLAWTPDEQSGLGQVDGVHSLVVKNAALG
jgi:hypothetical protein